MDSLEQARQLHTRGEIGRAIALLEEAIAAGDETCEIYKETARLCLLVNEVRAFTNYCHESMRLDPDDPEPHLMIARVLAGADRWEEALEALEHALTMAALTGTQRVEAEQLALTARTKWNQWKKANPGYSTL